VVLGLQITNVVSSLLITSCWRIVQRLNCHQL